MSHLVSCHLSNLEVASAFRSSFLPVPLPASRPLAWWRCKGPFKPNDIDLISACLDGARAVTVTSIPDTGDLAACCNALEDLARSSGGSRGNHTTLDLLASALLVAIEGAQLRLAEWAPMCIADLCLPFTDGEPEALPDPNAIANAEALLARVRRRVAAPSDEAISREVRR